MANALNAKGAKSKREVRKGILLSLERRVGEPRARTDHYKSGNAMYAMFSRCTQREYAETLFVLLLLVEGGEVVLLAGGDSGAVAGGVVPDGFGVGGVGAGQLG